MFGFECSFGFSLAVSLSVYLVAFYRFGVYGRAVTLFIAQFVQSKSIAVQKSRYVTSGSVSYLILIKQYLKHVCILINLETSVQKTDEVVLNIFLVLCEL